MAYKIINNNADYSDESLSKYGARTGVRTLARSVERILGTPGDIAQAAEGINNYIATKLTGEDTNIPFFNPNLINLTNKGIEKLTGKSDLLGKYIAPTSDELRQTSSNLTGGLTEPKNENEAFYDTIISDAAALLMPTAGGKLPLAKNIGKALTRSAIGNTAKWATEEVTGSPLLGTGVKIGTMALASTYGGRNKLEKLKKESYDAAENQLSNNVLSDFNPEIKKLGDILENVKKYPTKDKEYVSGILKDIKNIPSENGKASVRDMINFKKALNEHIFDGGIRSSTRRTLEDARNTVNEGIARYGKTNPEFYQQYKQGEELHRALEGTSYVQKLVSESPKLKKLVDNDLIKHLLHVGLYKGAAHLLTPGTAALAGGAYGLYQSGRTLQLIMDSPIAKTSYMNLMKAGLKNDLKALPKYLTQLNKAANDFEIKHPQQESSQSKGKYKIIHH